MSPQSGVERAGGQTQAVESGRLRVVLMQILCVCQTERQDSLQEMLDWMFGTINFFGIPGITFPTY